MELGLLVRFQIASHFQEPVCCTWFWITLKGEIVQVSFLIRGFPVFHALFYSSSFLILICTIKHAEGLVLIVISQALIHDSGSIVLEWDWGFPNDSDTRDVQTTHWEKWQDFTFLRDKLNLTIIMSNNKSSKMSCMFGLTYSYILLLLLSGSDLGQIS